MCISRSACEQLQELTIVYVGNEARHFSAKEDTVSSRNAAVAPAGATYSYTNLPGIDVPFISEFISASFRL